jgi:hypothetical protein
LASGYLGLDRRYAKVETPHQHMLTLTGAEESAENDGMVSGHLDMKYMGVHTIWNNDLGKTSTYYLVLFILTKIRKYVSVQID